MTESASDAARDAEAVNQARSAHQDAAHGRDIATRTDRNGLSECQEFTFERDARALPYHFRQNKRGMWEQIFFNEETQRWNKSDGYGLRIGERDHYIDPHF